jgi:hypothetical protein
VSSTRSVTVASHSPTSRRRSRTRPLADLALGGADAVMGVEREPGDLDGHLGLRGRSLVVVVVVLVVLELVVEVVVLRRHRRAT